MVNYLSKDYCIRVLNLVIVQVFYYTDTQYFANFKKWIGNHKIRLERVDLREGIPKGTFPALDCHYRLNRLGCNTRYIFFPTFTSDTSQGMCVI